MTTKPKLIVPKHVWDGKKAEKEKKELEKIPQPVGWRIVLFPLKLKGKTKEDAMIITANYLNMLSNKEYDENVELEDAIVYQGVRKFPARIKCASIAWKAFEGTLEESE